MFVIRTQIMIALCLGLTMVISAQADIRKNKEDGGYEFRLIKEIQTNPVKDQHRSGTCWSFSALSFIEAELARMDKPMVDLSEMFIVWNAYLEKAKKYVRLHGSLNFGPGGAFHDVVNMIKKYGIVPNSAYDGNNIDEDKIMHGEMDAVLEGLIKGVIKNKNGQLTNQWENAFKAVLDAYMGPVPETFEYEDKEYNPKSFAKFLNIEPENYITLSSYTHHPFYESFIMEVPDNWAWDKVYNVTIADLESIINNALVNDFSVAWASDVSEKGFSFKNGVAIVPQKNWSDMTKEERDSVFNQPIEEKNITQELRQKAFDNYRTTDDHGMHITGYAQDQNGKRYYLVKNSWGDDSNDCGGYFYASKAFVLYKTMDIMVHKDAIPENIRKALKI